MGAFRSMRSLQPGQGMVGRLWSRASQWPPVPSAWVRVPGRAFPHPQLAAQGLKQPFWAAPTRRSPAGCRAPEHGPAQTQGSAPVGWGCEASLGRNPWPCCPPPTVSSPNIHTVTPCGHLLRRSSLLAALGAGGPVTIVCSSCSVPAKLTNGQQTLWPALHWGLRYEG